MYAKDIMTKNVVTATPEVPVSEVAGLLVNSRISAVPVVDPDNRVVGIVSEGDLMRRPESGTEPRHSWWLSFFETAEERAYEYARTHSLTAGDVMTRDVVSVTDDTPVGDIAQLLEERKIKRVPVTQDGKLVGIVSRANLLHALATRPAATERPTSGEQSLREDILEVLNREFGRTDHFINIVVNGGVAHLWGMVESVAEKKAIRIAVETVAGPEAVVDHISVLSPNMRSLIWVE